LVTPSHVQHVVGHVGARYVVGDHGHTVGAVGAGSFGDVAAADKGGRRDGIDVGCGGNVADGEGLLHGVELELKVEHGRGVGSEGVGLARGGETGGGDSDNVIADGDGSDGESSGRGGECAHREGGVGGLNFYVCAGDGAVLGIVYDAMDLAEDAGVGHGSGQQKEKQNLQKLAH